MLRRIVEFIFGVVIVVFLLASYGDRYHPVKHLIEYITSNGFLQIIIVIALIILAARLIAGKKKDYSPFFYNLLVKIFGLKKKDN